YRLKQFDFDGSHSYSDVIAIKSEWDNSQFFGSIFPNPAKTAFTIMTGAREVAAPITMTFINAQGSVVRSEELLGHTNAANYAVNISDLPSGVYTIQLESGNESEVRKIVIL
ncbi:MAG: T9SS type A sorting domain-containing protein, partial [bacterium]|nr:T9SS type A sorting domain-containing protein [bacterium]